MKTSRAQFGRDRAPGPLFLKNHRGFDAPRPPLSGDNAGTREKGPWSAPRGGRSMTCPARKTRAEAARRASGAILGRTLPGGSSRRGAPPVRSHRTKS